jgi:hypothetical protein
MPSVNIAEGRAGLSPPSLRLFLLSAVLLAIAAVAVPAAAQAAPSAPRLTGTNPVSPGASLTPLIQGRADEVIISVIRMTVAVGAPLGVASGAGAPIAMAVDPNDTITVYAEDPTCSDAGAIAAVGTAGELEGAGIQVSVEPDSTTTFYATREDATGTSACSGQSAAYRQVSAPPAVPVLESVNPASPANDNSPHLIGSADAEATVSIYPNPSCTGLPIATGTGAAFGAGGIQVSVADNSETTFRATATLGGFASACSSSSISYREATPPPPPSEPGGGSSAPGSSSGSPPAPPLLRTIPGGRANDDTPLVAGTAPGATSVEIFDNPGCNGAPVAKGSAGQLASGLPVRVADNTTTSFAGVAIGGGGQSACSAPVVYVEDSTPPHTRITMGPGAKTRRRSAILRFTDTSGDEPGTAFLCKVDRGKWRACGSPLRLRRLKLRSHTVRVKAIDPAGNEEGTGAKRRFKVIRRP